MGNLLPSEETVNMTLQHKRLNLPFEPIDPQKAGVYPLLIQRSSQGSFADDDLERQQIIQLLQAARCAPSSHNSQPWYFIVVTNGAGREDINQNFIQSGVAWAAQAPVLLAVILNLRQSTRQNGLNYGLFDCGLAVQNILLQATAMKLAAHPVNYYDPEIMRRILKLPRTHRLVLFVAVGYPDDQPVVTESNHLRKPLATIAAWDRWDGALVLE
jgi:nitroreductase